MKSFLFGYDRGVRICLRCHGWFLSEGAHARFCALCRVETKAIEVLPCRSQQSDDTSPLAATVATREEVGETVS